jgi:hypothetical protein
MPTTQTTTVTIEELLEMHDRIDVAGGCSKKHRKIEVLTDCVRKSHNLDELIVHDTTTNKEEATVPTTNTTTHPDDLEEEPIRDRKSTNTVLESSTGPDVEVDTVVARICYIYGVQEDGGGRMRFFVGERFNMTVPDSTDAFEDAVIDRLGKANKNALGVLALCWDTFVWFIRDPEGDEELVNVLDYTPRFSKPHTKVRNRRAA